VVLPHRPPPALFRWWWRTPIWSRLLASLGGGFLVFSFLIVMVAPARPAQPAPNTIAPTTSTRSATQTTSSPTTSSSTTQSPTTTSTTTTAPVTTLQAAVPQPEPQPQPQPNPAPVPEPAPQPPNGGGSGGTVHGGAFCSPAGSTGLSETGKSMICAPAKDGRLRWRQA
jgi:hypothetical protein